MDKRLARAMRSFASGFVYIRNGLLPYNMAFYLWLLLSTVLFMAVNVFGRTYTLDCTYKPGYISIHLSREGWTNYTLLTTSKDYIVLRKFIKQMDSRTGHLCLTTNAQLINRIFNITLTSMNILSPGVKARTDFLLVLKRTRCYVERSRRLLDIDTYNMLTKNGKNRTNSSEKKTGSVSGGSIEETSSFSPAIGGKITAENGDFTLSSDGNWLNINDKPVWDGQPDRKSETRKHEGLSLRRRRDASDNMVPRFSKTREEISIKEDVKIGCLVYQVSATTQAVSNQPVLYYAMTPVGNIRSKDFFNISHTSGEICTTKELDRETMSIHTFRVTATTNVGSSRLQAQMVLVIKVMDVNDHVPIFDKAVYTANISESEDVDYVVLGVRTHDSDTGLNKKVRYSIVNNGDINHAFVIDQDSGIITVNQMLDREKVAFYNITIQAKDQGSPSLSSTAIVVITILDDNDCRPEFNQSGYYFKIPENSRKGVVVGVTNATDCDIGLNQKIKYSITSGNDDQTFDMSPRTGVIRVRGKLDYEKKSLYSLMVTAEDYGEIPEDSEVMVEIAITDINDNPPDFLKDEYRFKVPEDARIGQPVGTVYARDRDHGDNGKVDYFLKAGQSPFKIDKTSGKIRTTGVLDREKISSYQLEVIAQDRGVNKLRKAVNVYVTIEDVNDSPPYFTRSTYNATIPEKFSSNRVFLRITADDKDLDSRIQYSTRNVPRNCFTIGSSNGGLVKSRSCKLDYKQKREYVFEVVASDGVQNTSVKVIVYVSDSNDNSPKFQNSSYSGYVYENQQAGTAVLQVKATDADFGENARITYSIVRNSTVFKIDPVTGWITSLVVLDREKTQKYRVRVRATDNGEPKRSSRRSAKVTIKVRDVNDNRPQFQQDVYEVSMKEDEYVGTLVIKVQASDNDDNKNKQITYSLLSKGNEDGVFKIHPYLGDIELDKPLDREQVPLYILTVLAKDGGTPSLNSTAVVKVTVEDVIDSPPVFLKPRYVANVSEDVKTRYEVVQVKAVTKDSTKEAEIQYDILSGNFDRKFTISGTSGNILVASPLDYETKTQYVLKVQAMYASFLKTVDVVINIEDVNDMAPVLEPRFEIIINLRQNIFPSGLTFKIPAYDPDKSSVLTYSVENVPFNVLTVDKDTGVIDLKESALTNTGGVTFDVKVTDGKFKAASVGNIRLNVITYTVLNASVAVYFKNATVSKFFGMFEKFKKVVADILSVRQSNILIFDVVNKTVSLEKLWYFETENFLTVWLTVQGTRGKYLDGSFISNMLFLNKEKLERETTMVWLPSDEEMNPDTASNHDVYVKEACAASAPGQFLTCTMNKIFEPSQGDVLNSPTVLFKGLRIREVAKKVCPPGFYGRSCNFELDSCYSTPCKENGQCINFEGGYSCKCEQHFVGKTCNIDTRKGRCSNVPYGVCRNGGVCQNTGKTGFACQCPTATDHSPSGMCFVDTRSFHNDSFVAFNGLPQRWHIEISFEFATVEQDGLLMFVGRYELDNDFMAVELKEGRVRYLFSTGGDVQTVSLGKTGKESLTEGQWNKVTISYQNQIGALVLGEKCDTSVAVMFGNQVGNFSCAAAKKLKHFRSMDLNSPLFFGGFPYTIHKLPIRGKGFDGCIRNVRINHVPLDLGSPIFDKGSHVGCGPKRDACRENPCRNSGQCVTTWNTRVCQCPPGFSGALCEIETKPLDFTQKSSMIFQVAHQVLNVPWTISMMLRTVQGSGTIAEIMFGANASMLQLDGGILHLSNDHLNMTSPGIRLDDGEWHHVSVTWTMTSISVHVDHVHQTEGVSKDGTFFNGLVKYRITIGDVKKSGDGFNGCIKGLAINGVSMNTSNATRHLISDGCTSTVKCDTGACPEQSVCKVEWRRTTCKCLVGYVGDGCVDVCTLNPCQNQATCTRTKDASGFECKCLEKYSGKYCEIKSQLPCRDGFYSRPGSKFCGPCECQVPLDYNPVCNKTNGFCYCKDNHYRELLSDGGLGERCVPCECDSLGSRTQTCDPIGGQCPCLPGVIGRLCDMCKEKQGEITQNGKGCSIINTSCPRAKSENVVWERVNFGIVAKQKCPYSSQGVAERLCAVGKGWQTPDMTDCTTTGLIGLERKLQRSGNLTTEKAITMSKELENTFFERKHFFQKDVAIAYKIIMALMRFESSQREMKLASSRDTKFLDIMLNAVSKFVDKRYKNAWSLIDETPPASVSLMRQLEEFGICLASNIVYLKREQRRERRSKTNLQSMIKFQPNVFMQLEPVDPSDFGGLLFSLKDLNLKKAIPAGWQNRTNRIEIPASIFENPGAPKRDSAIAFIVLKKLASILPRSYDISESDTPDATAYTLQVNSDVVVIGIEGMESIYLKDPITIEFENHELNHSQYECVFWNYSIPGSNGGGWSTSGCSKIPSNSTHTICQCHHLTSFAVVSDLEIQVPVVARFTIEIVTYVGIAISLALLLFTVLSFTCLSGLNSNTNNIHRSMVAAIVIAELVYLFGINRTSSKLICRFIAIVLHYFFDAVFAWMFVEVIHMYRMLAEKRNIDSGQMTFYYFLGWGCPAIVVGLSTGMAVEGYGNDRFCWMTTSGTLIWTFAIPIVAVMLSNSAVFLMALSLSVKKARRRKKHNTYNPNSGPVTSVYKNTMKIKYALKVGAAFLPILAITLIFAVLAVNENLLVFHYLFALLCCCQSIFIILFYVVFDPKVREEYKNAYIRWKTGDKTYGKRRRKRLFEKSYHPGSNLAGEEGYGLRGRNGETTSTDRSTSTLHSSSVTRTDPFSTFPEDDTDDTDFKEPKKTKHRKEDPIDMESAAKLWNAPEKSEVSTTQPESSDSSDGRRRETMIISSDSGSSGEDSGSWEQKATEKQIGAAPLYASDGPMHSTPFELEQEKARLLKERPREEKPVVEKLPESKLPSILKNSSVASPVATQPPKSQEVQPSPATLAKSASKPAKTGSEASSGSSLSSEEDDEDDLVLQAKLLSQSTDGAMSTLSSKERKKKTRKTRDMQFGKKSRHHRVHFHRPSPNPNANPTANTTNANADDGKKVRVKTSHLPEGKHLTGHHV